MWLKEFGLPGISGALLGILLVSWIQPATTAGVGFLILLSVLLTVAISSAFSRLRQRKDSK
jgi:hypothetical protein